MCIRDRSWAVHYFPCGDLVQRQLDRLIGKLLARFLCLVSDIASALRREVDQQIAVAHTFHPVSYTHLGLSPRIRQSTARAGLVQSITAICLSSICA